MSEANEDRREHADSTAPASDEDAFGPAGREDEEIDDEAPTLRRPPVGDDGDRWFGRDTLTSAAVFAIGVATLAYAAISGSPPYPQRALASGASVAAEAAR